MIEYGLIQKVASGDMSDPKVRIARAAIEEFAMRSLDGARIREIAKKSGANVAAISYHFGGKKALYNAVVEGVSDYFEDSVKPFYDRGEAVFEKNDSAAATNLAREFLIDTIRKFSEVDIVPAFCLIMARETASPSESFRRVYDSIFRKPVDFLSRLLQVASKGRLARDVGIVFAQALWSNVRSYSSKSGAILKLHSWKKIGDAELDLLDSALSKVLSKTLK